MAKKPNLAAFGTSLKASIQSWESGDSPRIHVAHGKSDYLLHKTTELFRTTIKKHENIHYSAIEGGELTTEVFRSLWQSQSLFEPVSAYAIKRAEKTKQLPKLLSGLRSSNAVCNHILLSLSVASINQKLKAELDRLGSLYIPCFEPPARDIPAFIDHLCKNHKLDMNRKAQSFLHTCLGDDMFRIENEIQKLQLIFAPTKNMSSAEVTCDDISNNLGLLREDQAYKIANLLLEKSYIEAQAHTVSLIRKGASPLSILGIISNHIRRTIAAGGSQQGGSASQRTNGYFRGMEFLIPRYNRYARSLDLRKMSFALRLCQEADVKFKSSKHRYDDIVIGKIISMMP